jgi:uncharacterized protein involved in exopolysaccharide biosynthesis
LRVPAEAVVAEIRRQLAAKDAEVVAKDEQLVTKDEQLAAKEKRILELSKTGVHRTC